MFIAPGIRGQSALDDLMDFSGTIASGGVAQLVLPQQPRRASLFICNLHATDTITIGIGPATAHATVTSNTISAITVDNAGIGYAVAPNVRIIGGLVRGDYMQSPSHPATAHAVMTGSAPNMTISSIVVDDPGAGYQTAPYIYLENPLPNLGGGAKVPSATVGIPLPAGWTLNFNGSIVIPAAAVAIYGPTTNDPYEVKVGGLL